MLTASVYNGLSTKRLQNYQQHEILFGEIHFIIAVDSTKDLQCSLNFVSTLHKLILINTHARWPSPLTSVLN